MGWRRGDLEGEDHVGHAGCSGEEGVEDVSSIFVRLLPY